MQNIYSHIDENKRKTWFVIIGFILVVTLIGWFLGEYYFEGSALSYVGLALIISGISGFFSYYNSDKIVLAVSKAKELKQEQSPELYHLVENMTIASGLPMPKIYIIEDSAMNAFATGRDPKHAVICFTTGIVEALDKRELEGVVAHEMSHIGNYDIRLMSIVSVLVGSIALIADWFTRGVFYGGGRRRNGGSGGGIMALLGLALIIISPVIATLIKLALSRNREYLADADAALLTRNPRGLANALMKISNDREVLEAANGATAHLFIANPLKGEQGSFMANLFSTHPPVQERIRRLLTM
jgi:heat shock protein HtpX